MVKPILQLENLVVELRAKEPARRMRAREALVHIGKPAVQSLIGLLSDSSEHVRWEACKALASIKDPAASMPLVQALQDDSIEVQWLAAEGLIALKSKCVIPLLESLEENFESSSLRQGAHHVLHALERQKLLRKETVAVVDSLRSLQPVVAVGVAARKALLALKKTSR